MFKTNPSFLQILPNKKTLYFVLLTLLFGLSGIAFSAYLKVSGQTAEAQSNMPGETTAQQCPTCRPPSPQVIYAPLIEFSEASRSEIVFNCRSSHIIDAVPTFYTDSGEPIVGQTISLKPAEMRFVDVMSLIPAEHRNRQKWGGMSLSYTGNSMEVWAQLTLHGIGQNGSTDVLFVVVNAQRSNVREAVWRMPKNAAATIALGNYSDSLTVATLTYSNGETEQVNVAPYATEIVKRRNNGQNQSDTKAESVRIESSGELGRLIPTGLVISNNGDFASSIRFYDPQNIAQPNLYATNFRLKDSTPHLVLKNTSDNPVTARARFLPAAGEGDGVVELPAVTIAANAIKEVNLTTLVNEAKTRADLDSVSVQIINSGAAGSLVGAINTTNNLTKVDYDIPLRDSGLTRNSAGGYTVRLDDDYSTILSITNVGEKSGKFTMQVNFDGGFYALYPQKLEPGATATFDIRKIRDQQIPDSSGRQLPLNFAFGQIRWSLVGAPQTRLIGRSEVVSKSKSVSSSYSCFVCCPNIYNNGSITPYSAEVDAGETFQFSSQQQDRDCYQNLYSPYPVDASWTVNDEQIAQVGSDGSTTAISEGDAYLTANWTGQLWYADATEACLPDEIAVNRNANLIVRPPSASISSFKAVGKNQTATVRVQVSNNPNNLPITLTLAPTSGTGTAQFTSNNTTTRTITATTDVEIKGITESSTKDNMEFKATYTKPNNQIVTLDTEDFSVIWVTLTLKTSVQISSDNAARSTYNSVLGTTTLSTFKSLPNSNGDELWRTGMEYVGIVAPSNFTENIVLKREITGKKQYNNNVEINPRTVPFDDTSDPPFRDDNPQSGNSNGKVYDLDAPGIATASIRPIGFILRDRTNFREYATYTENSQEQKVSDDLLTFSRISIQKTSTGDVLINDIPGENIAGTGTTKLSYDLTIPPWDDSSEPEKINDNLSLRNFPRKFLMNSIEKRSNRMNKIVPLAATLALLLQSSNCMPIFGQILHPECQTNKKEEVSKLLTIIRTNSLVENEPEQVIRAINRLGELKAKEAVNDLIPLLTFKGSSDYDNPELQPPGGIVSPYKVFPAVKALYQIGENSIPALIKVIETEQENSLASRNAQFTVFSLYKDNPSKIVELLKEAANKSSNSEGAARLLNAAKKIDEIKQ